MRNIMYAILAIGIVATFAAPRLAVSQNGGAVACRPMGGRCIQTTAANYNGCVNLALRRGLDLTKGDRHNLDQFVYNCVAGRVTR
jgi:hypothetical protein